MKRMIARLAMERATKRAREYSARPLDGWHASVQHRLDRLAEDASLRWAAL